MTVADVELDDLPAPALLLVTVAAAPPEGIVARLREMLPVTVSVVDLPDLPDAVAHADRPLVVVPWLLSSSDEGGAATREATRGVRRAITTSALGPHPVLSGELADAVRRAGLPVDGGIVVVAAPPAGTALMGEEERPAVSGAMPAEPDPDDLPDEQVAGRRDVAQVVYDVDSIWVGPVAGALAGAQPSPLSVVRRMAADGRSVAVVQYALTDLTLDTQRLALVGASAVIRPGVRDAWVGVVVDRYEQGVAELRAGLDEDAWSAPLV